MKEEICSGLFSAAYKNGDHYYDISRLCPICIRGESKTTYRPSPWPSSGIPSVSCGLLLGPSSASSPGPDVAPGPPSYAPPWLGTWAANDTTMENQGLGLNNNNNTIECLINVSVHLFISKKIPPMGALFGNIRLFNLWVGTWLPSKAKITLANLAKVKKFPLAKSIFL